MKFLIDECLSPELAQMAHARGHGESSHVVWIGRSGIKDWDLLPVVLEGNWTLVTRNSYDFRGPLHAPGTAGQYRRAELHAGLVCLNGPDGMDLEMQCDLFTAALDDLEQDDDLVNQVLEVTLETADSEEIVTQRYALPKEPET
ncbi:MAG: DUF5615 family PIN-like protein [Proteobacteria bacterium]|nr:DUF5615 family PIN-like protein [Pseudomonadota bacterium]